MTEAPQLFDLNPQQQKRRPLVATLKRHRVYLVEFSMAVFLSLRDMKNLVHVRLPLLPGDSGEQQAGYQKVGAAERSEDVAFEFLHV